MEGNKPSVTIELPTPYIGLSQEITGLVSDPENGIRKLWVGLLQDGKEIVLLDKEFTSKFIIGGGAITETPFTLLIEPKKLKLSDGKAMLRIAVTDYSWRKWFHGNKTYIEKEIIIDTRPPVIDVLTSQHYIRQGGSGVVIYRVSEQDIQSGVVVGDNFFPGYAGHFETKNIYMAFIALGHLQDMDTKIHVKATDAAGNYARAGFNHYLKKGKFKTDNIRITDSFLNWKMPEFDLADAGGGQLSNADQFLAVNRDIRQASTRILTNLGEQTDHTIYWKGAFSRLPGSSTKASFAEYRTYTYQGKIIDRQYHMGIDLASTSHSPVPAANSGRVAYQGTNGIYGKTVAIDHGFGLFSIYSHLSRIHVKEGDRIEKGDTLGVTGTTGLAGGDHLHFGMMIHHVFVNPIEWWDKSWIHNNITAKIQTIYGR